MPAYAQEEPLTRRDGFLQIWNSIHRKAYETWKTPYKDVSEGDKGFKEITWAKRRGITIDAEYFNPRERLAKEDALLWLFRTRNVDELKRMQSENLTRLLERYPIAQEREGMITASVLEGWINDLDRRLREEVHEVSFYADDFHGDHTAFGEFFDMNAISAAHRTLPHNTLVKVTNIDTGQSVVVRINDRGPYVDGRDMDLSKAAFLKIGHEGQGTLQATFDRLGDSELIDGSQEEVVEVLSTEAASCVDNRNRHQQRITRDVRFQRGIPHLFELGRSLTLKANRYVVIRWIHYPDGYSHRLQDFISPEEKFTFKPDVEGDYRFLIGNAHGRMREMRMRVIDCGE